MGNCSVKILKESGFEEAMFGMMLAYDRGDIVNIKSVDLDRAYKRANILSFKNGGHSKSLESMIVWLDIVMPRFWWIEFATYRVGTSTQSQSTMHTLKKGYLEQNDFYKDIYEPHLDYLNHLIKIDVPIDEIKNELPEGFLQRRIVCTNYKCLQNIVMQRMNHKLSILWRDVFIESLKKELDYPEFIFK